MNGEWIYIEKNGRVIWAYKRMQSAIRRFELVCERSFKGEDVVRMISESGEVIKEF